MNELLILFNFLCSSSPFTVDQAACTKALEAYSIQTGMSKTYTDSRQTVVNEAEKTINISPAIESVAYSGTKYATTKKVALTLPLIKNTAISIKGSTREDNGSINLSIHF